MNEIDYKFPIIPREILFGDPEKSAPSISPNGKILAYIAPYKSISNIWIRGIYQKNAKALTRERERGIYKYFWSFDNRHILFMRDIEGDENSHLFGVNIKTGKIKDFTPFKGKRVKVIGMSKKFPREINIAVNLKSPNLYDVYRVNLSTGEIHLIEENPGDIYWWYDDEDLNIKGASRFNKDGSLELLIRDKDDKEGKPLIKWGTEDRLTSLFLHFTSDGKYFIFKDSRNSKTSVLKEININKGTEKILASSLFFDVGEIITDPISLKPQTVAFIKDKKRWEVIDKSIEEDFNKIRSMDLGEFSIVSKDKEDKIWIIAFSQDIRTSRYYIYNRKNKRGQFLFEEKPLLKKYKLSNMEPFEINARDNLKLRGYMTFPLLDKRKNLPLVLLVHGGPWLRDKWGYSSDIQWLANRGYLVLQVNFRGSWGYGKDFLNASNLEWGNKMQDDLVDVVKWAIKKGFACRDKVAVMGYSYGGYAALMAAAKHSDIFCCAIDIFGPSSLISLIENFPPYWEPLKGDFIKRVGDPKKDIDFLKKRSPLYLADDIKIPVFIAQGRQDPRVNKIESEQIVAVLKKNKIPHTYFKAWDEGHCFVRPQTRIVFHAALEKFLYNNLGGRYQKEIIMDKKNDNPKGSYLLKKALLMARNL